MKLKKREARKIVILGKKKVLTEAEQKLLDSFIKKVKKS